MEVCVAFRKKLSKDIKHLQSILTGGLVVVMVDVVGKPWGVVVVVVVVGASVVVVVVVGASVVVVVVVGASVVVVVVVGDSVVVVVVGASVVVVVVVVVVGAAAKDLNRITVHICYSSSML